MNQNFRISTSWDDGSIHDLKLTDLLNNYCIPAILFIPGQHSSGQILDKNNIRDIYNNFEIGSHTYTHIPLDRMTNEKAIDEIKVGRKYLEDIVGDSVPHFCFPGGRYTNSLLKEASAFVDSARTTEIYCCAPNSDFLVNTTLQLIYKRKTKIPKVFWHWLKNCPTRLKSKLVVQLISDNDVNKILSIFLEYAIHQNKCLDLHFWGHSWEIEQEGSWRDLEESFRILSDYNQYFSSYSNAVNLKSIY